MNRSNLALALASLSMSFVHAALAQPANNNCADAIPLANGSVTTFNTSTATRDGVGITTCLNFSAARDIWYTYTSAGAEHIVLDLCGSGPMVKGLAAFSGTCGATTQIACNRTGGCGAGQPQLIFDTPGAGTHLIYLATLQSSGDFSGVLTLNAAPLSGAPTADGCTQAFPVAGDYTIAFDTAGLTTDGASSCGGSSDGWFRWTPSRSGVGTVTTCGLTSGDTVLSAFASCSGAELACNNDFCGTASQIVFPVTMGAPVIVRLASATGAPITGQVRFSAAPALPNDTCAGAQVIAALGSVNVDTTFATTQGPSGSCNGGGAADSHDLFFRYTAGNEGFITVDTLQGPSTLDTTLQVFDACNGHELACNDDADAGNRRSRTCPLAVTPGTQYIIRLAVWGVNSSGGSTVLRVAAATPSVFSVPVGAIPEPGNECDEYDDDVNFGCDALSPTLEQRRTTIALCETYRGFAPSRTLANSHGNLVHDADSYQFTLLVPSRITVLGQAQFRAISFVGGAGCPVTTFTTPTNFTAPCGGVADFSFTTNESLQPGTWSFTMANDGDLSATCGHNDEYWFRLSLADGPCPCRADFNHDGDLNPDDLGDFITCYFTEPPCVGADFNGDNDVNPDDLGDFITQYFLGC